MDNNANLIDPELLKEMIRIEYKIHSNPSEDNIIRAIDIAADPDKAEYIVDKDSSYRCSNCQEICFEPTITCECCAKVMKNYIEMKKKYIKEQE